MQPFNELKEKIIEFLEKEPQKVFLAMIIIIALSVIIVFTINSNKRKVSFEEVMNEITNNPEGYTPSHDQMPSMIDLGLNSLKIKEIEKSLDSLNRKQNLTPADSLRARILLRELRQLIQ